MSQHTSIKFIKRKNYFDVIIYYSKNGLKFRPSADVKVDPKHILDSGKISSKHPNYDDDMEKIKAVQDKVELLIKQYKDKYKDKPPVDWLEKEFEKPLRDAKKDLQDVLSYWKEFIAEKEATTRADGTINRYNNLKQMLLQFKEKRNQELSFDALDQIFFNNLVTYMANEHEYVRNHNMKKPDSVVAPEVGLSNETSIKRLKDFIEYLKFCTIEFDVPINLEKIKKYVNLAKRKSEVKSLSKTQKWELTLTPDEIQFAVNLDYYAPDFWKSITVNQKRYLDILIFMCLQGTAPIDTKSIARTDIRKNTIVKERSKSGNEFRVELDAIAAEILERYDYNLNFTDQTLNDELKWLFVTILELYKPHYEEKYGEKYELICSQKMKKGNKDVFTIKHKGLFVELMTGRRSFLTNLAGKANELGLKEVMDKAGHVIVATTLGYIHQQQQGKKTESLFNVTRLKR